METAPVHFIFGRPTAFVAGRRLVLTEDHATRHTFDLTPEIKASLPDIAPDRFRLLSLRIALLGEGAANRLGSVAARLLPWSRFWAAFAILASAATVASVWSASNATPQLFSIPTWRDLALHYMVLAGILLWHEIGHLAAASKAGLRVDGLGGGFYLVFPALFTSMSLIVLAPYRDRMKIYAAGVMAQCALGLVLSLLLHWSDDPILRFAVIANLSTIAINLIPGLRLDGHRMIEEIIAQKWAGPYQSGLKGLTRVSAALIGLVSAVMTGRWLFIAIPATMQTPTVLGLVTCVLPVSLLALCLVNLIGGFRRRA